MIQGKTLYRSRKDRIISGICGGLGEYFEVDSNLIRLLWILFAFAGGTGILAYIAAYFIIPERPRTPLECSNCGHINQADAIYCQNCGNLIEKPKQLQSPEGNNKNKQ